MTESKAADAETFNRREVWRITLEKSLAIVNEMYDTNITFKMVEPDFDAGEADETETNNEGEEVNNNVGE